MNKKKTQHLFSYTKPTSGQLKLSTLVRQKAQTVPEHYLLEYNDKECANNELTSCSFDADFSMLRNIRKKCVGCNNRHSVAIHKDCARAICVRVCVCTNKGPAAYLMSAPAMKQFGFLEMRTALCTSELLSTVVSA